MDSDAYLSSEVRPWGNFRVFLLNAPLDRWWASKFFRSLAEEYPEASKDGRLFDYMEGLLSTTEKRKSTTVKIITVNLKSRLSLQFHRLRSEEWFCLKGEAVATVDSFLHRLGVAGTVSVPREARHRLESAGGAQVLEVATGDFDESDIVRIEDDYARAAPLP